MERQVKTGIYYKDGVEEVFSFYTNLRATDKVMFVNSVIDSVVDADNKRYNLVIKNLVFEYMFVKLFSDVVIPENMTIDDIEDFLIETNIMNIIKSNIEYGLIEELNEAVDKALEYYTGIHVNPIAESISKLLNTIEQKVSDIDTKTMTEMAQIFSNVSGELTANKIVEAYSKSDLFKQVHK